MCGINGFINPNVKDTTSSLGKLALMNQSILHRGPDSDGFFVSDDCKVAMAMRRLSIIDLDTGEQPIYSEDRKRVIVFNGEIYNYQNLREELLTDGYIFSTASDTEVILKIYERDGIAGFGKLDGMFAFSIYDSLLEKVIIARDFFGEKPLYYTQADGMFCWASELKSIQAVLASIPPISAQGLSLYFQLSYIPAPYTIYEGIHKLKANHYLVYDLASHQFETGEIQKQVRQFIVEDKPAATRLTESLVRSSVSSRSISDVPIGSFLSGGVDSSIVSLCMAQASSQKINTFSIGFSKKAFDETAKSREVAKMIGSDHHEFILSEKHLLDDLSDIVLNFDEPFADSSALPSYVVAHETRNHVKVALTGDGGDEVFGGYNKYYIGKLNEKYTAVVPQRLHDAMSKRLGNLLVNKDDNRGLRFKLAKLLRSINYGGGFYYNIISLGFQSRELSDVLKPAFWVQSPLAPYKEKIGTKSKTLLDFRNIDRLLSLEGDMLVKVDRTSMLNSLECRAPFLNKELWDFTAQLPEAYLINGWDKKYILKEAFRQYFPKGFLDKSKKGFGIPVGDWLRASLREELQMYLQKDFIEKQGIFHYAAIANIVNKHISGEIDNTFKVWSFFCFQKWYTSVYEKK